MVAKFTANGDLLWQKLHQGAAPGSGVTDVQLDSKGNLIAFGDTTNAGLGLDTTVLKINPQGKLSVDAETSPNHPISTKFRRAGAVDHNDGIYATGDALNIITGESFPYTLKYDTNGSLSFLLTGAGIGGSFYPRRVAVVQHRARCPATRAASSGTGCSTTALYAGGGALLSVGAVRR